MNNDVVVHAMQDAPMPRRDFLRKSVLLALPAAFGGIVAPAAAAISMSSPLPAALSTAAYSPPERYRGSTVINVRNHGALGNGVHDDTNAFQNAIDALPADGGTVVVPVGTYLIDPIQRVSLRSRMHLSLASGAVLKAKANSAERAYMLMLHKISDVAISGGEIEGDRDRHTGTTGQWGHGIMVRGASRVTIRDILIRKCWGDGITIAASVPGPNVPRVVGDDIVIANVACLDNRRAGMSVGQSRQVKVYDSEFSYTSGITPGCGINVESDFDNPGASDLRIENCVLRHNQANGIQVYKRALRTAIRDNTIEYNNGYGVLVMGAATGWINANRIRHNQLIGIGIRAETNQYSMAQNHFYNNAKRFRSYDLPLLSPPSSRAGNVLPRHTEVVNSQNIAINTNLYYDD
jgi:hypothetical protein